MGDRDYFNKLNAQMERGGLAAMLHDLLNHDLSGFDVRDRSADRSAWRPEAAFTRQPAPLVADRAATRLCLPQSAWRRDLHPVVRLHFDRASASLIPAMVRRYPRALSDEPRRTREDDEGALQARRPRTGLHPIYEVETMDSEEGKPAVLQERPHGYMVGTLEQAQAAFAGKTGIAFDWEEGKEDSDEGAAP